MPYRKEKGHSECPAGKPWAVVKETDGEVMGCHASEADADKQIAALHANEADLVDGFLFVELADDEAKPVEFLTVGTFIDSRGRLVEVTEEDLDEYLANFEAGAAGQDVPIDVDHERKEAAGWVKAVEKVGKKLRFIPDWTKLGLELVGERIYRYVSATLDTANKVIKTISLVNLPSVKGLKPAELAEGVYTMKRLTVAQRLTQGIEQLLSRVFVGETDLVDGMPGTVRVGEYLQARIHKHFTILADDWAASGLLTVDERKALSGAIGAALEAFAGAVGDVGERLIQVPGPDLYYYSESEAGPRASEEETMSKTEAEIREEIRQEMEAELAQQQERETEMRERIREEERKHIEAELAERQKVVDLAEKLCGGDAGLSAKPEEVAEVLAKLDPDARAEVVDLLEAKIVNFGEVGSTREGRGGLVPLPKPYVSLLKRWLEDGNELAEFFAVNEEELGQMDQYELAEFQAADK